MLDGNLKRKSFAKGFYYIVNQTDLGKEPYNILERFKSLDEAQKKFNELNVKDNFAKVLVEGASGRIVDQKGPSSWVG